MTTIDVSRTWEKAMKRLESEDNPIFRRQLAEMIYHQQMELTGNVPPVLDRMSPRAYYMRYSVGNAPITYMGKDSILDEFYGPTAQKIDYCLVELAAESLVVDNGMAVIDGALKAAMKGSFLHSLGYDTVDSPEAYYLFEARHCVLWPFDEDGRSIGEHVYDGISTPLDEVAQRPLRPEELIPYTGPILDVDSYW
jgi:hypothetical protein